MLDLTGRGCSQIRDDEAQKSVARQDARQLMIFIWRDLLPMSSLTVPSSGGGKQLKQRCNAFLLYLSCEAVVRLRAPEAAAIDLAHDRPATHPRLIALDLRMCVSLCQQPCHLCTAHVVVLQRLGLRDLQDGLPPPGSDVTFSRLYCLSTELSATCESNPQQRSSSSPGTANNTHTITGRPKRTDTSRGVQKRDQVPDEDNTGAPSSGDSESGQRCS